MLIQPQTDNSIRTILCVDDDDDDASIFESAVNSIRKEIEFIKCYSGKDALDYLATTEEIPSLILLDVNMPILNGFDCLKEIRKDSRFDGVPIFVLSTSASPRDVSQAIALGAKQFLTKPNSFREICAMMGKLIQNPNL